VLLKQYDHERLKLEEKVVSNLNELTRPHLAQLAAGPLSPRQRSLLDAVNRSLDDITAPMSRRFILQGSQLTPAETQVAGLIRQGKSTKEIAELMGVARSTIDYHRFNIRRKLKLTNRRVNLQSYLRSLR
jgi:DNA-binding CsgD family transcriptional regulator